MARKPTDDELAHRVKTLELQIAGSGSVASIEPGPDFQIFTERKRAEEELQYRLKFQHLITHISSRFINLDPTQIDDEFIDTPQQIGEFAAADRSYVFQFSDNQKFVSCTHEWCAEELEPAIERLQNVSLVTFPWSIGKFLDGEMLVVPRVPDLPPEATNEKRELERQRIQSVLAVPLASGGRVIGFIGLVSVREEKMWAEDTNSLLKIVGHVFANALDNQKTRQALEESEQRLRTVFETFPAMNAFCSSMMSHP